MSTRKTLVGRIHSDVLAFTAGQDRVLDMALAEADCVGSAAHVAMLATLGLQPPLFTARECKAVTQELVHIIGMARRGAFTIRAEDQDVHLAVERKLTRALGDLGRRIHTARSRNDQVAVDLRLFGKEQILAVVEETAQLAEQLLKWARRYARVPMVGRTHFRPAMPSSVGLWASAHAESLLDDLVSLDSAYALNDRCPLGSAAGYGVPMKIDRALTAKLLGFRDPIHNVLYASNARGKCEAAILSALSNAMISLSRLSEDLILYTAPEFGYFALPPEYSTGSSIMPQKRNPDVLELVRAKSMEVVSCAATVMGIVRSMPSGYHRDLQETKEPFLKGFKTTRSCLRILTLLVPHLLVDKDALLRGFTPEVFAADQALEWVKQGVPFRSAYQNVREHLGDLSRRDPLRALKERTHLGAAGNLGLEVLVRRVKTAKRFVDRERKRYHRAISGLLGVPYPQLDAGKR